MSGSEQPEDHDQEARERYEARCVASRLKELFENPLQGAFDTAHLKAVHAYIFQDLPQHRPGIVRGDTEGWVKHRVLEGRNESWFVHYAHEAVTERLDDALHAFGGADALHGLAPGPAAAALAHLYGDLDFAHAFYEGNSRTLREFTRELSLAAEYTLDWIGTGIGRDERNELYIARDVSVLERAFPGLTPERGMQTDDRAEFEASLSLSQLRQAMGDKSLETIIRAGLAPLSATEQMQQSEGAGKPAEQAERTAGDEPPDPYTPHRRGQRL